MSRGSLYARMARLSAIMTILPSSMAAGWIIGYYLVDRYLLAFPLGTALMVLVGAGAGFYEIVRILTRDRKDAGINTGQQGD